MNAVSIRGDWVGQIVDGKFALLEWLGGSSSSGVFATELDGLGSQRAAIKLIPASSEAENRLANWASDASLSHPHLVKILHFGRGRVDSADVVYVVTELAEEVLSQIIPERALTADETREMLGPVVDALAYLHGEGQVHGHLKPSNILVVQDQVKLSVDGLLRAGKAGAEIPSGDIHKAPESGTAPPEAPEDVWSLGITLVEAMTQQTPIWDAAEKTDPQVPGLAKPFAEIVRECLHVNPARRCTVGEIREMLQGKARVAAAPAALQEARTAQRSAPERKARGKMPLVPLIVGFVLLVAVIIGLLIHNRNTRTAPMQAEKTIEAPPAEPKTGAPLPQTMPGGMQKGAALKRVMPDVPQAASNTIHGTVKVSVRVDVDPTGGVTNAELVSHGPSAYFARKALEAARNWTFQPPMQQGRAVGSAWMLHFEFRRSGVDATVEETEPR